MSVIKPEMTCHMQFKIVCLIQKNSKDVHLRLKIFLTIESTNLITIRKTIIKQNEVPENVSSVYTSFIKYHKRTKIVSLNRIWFR